MRERGYILASAESSLNMFYRGTGGSEEVLVASTYVYGQEGYMLLVVNNYCCGGIALGE